MPNPFFDFKQFRVRHDRCAMKVGTDAVLLGAWVKVDDSRHILDVGCGSGIISLMLAQRQADASVVGIDIDPDAVSQASENAKASPFSERCRFEVCDVRKFYIDFAGCDHALFDTIVCNPPFYTEDTLPPDDLRSRARNSRSLSFSELIDSVSRLLCDGGDFHVIIPASSEQQFTSIAVKNGFYLTRCCKVKTTENKAPKRTLCTYLNKQSELVVSEELVLNENGKKSRAFEQLTADFYLDVPQPS